MELWKYSFDSKQVLGPVPVDDVRVLISNGILQPDHLLQKEGTENWIPVRQSPFYQHPADRLASIPIPPSAPPAPKSGRRSRTRGANKAHRRPWIITLVLVCIAVFVFSYDFIQVAVDRGKSMLEPQQIAIQKLYAELRATQLLMAHSYNSDSAGKIKELSHHLRAIDTAACPGAVQQAFSEYVDAWDALASNPPSRIDPLLFHLSNQFVPQSSKIEEKLQSIAIPSVEFYETPLRDALDFLQSKSVELDFNERDPQKKGVNIILTANDSAPISIKLSNVPLRTALDYSAKLANMKIKIESEAVLVVELHVPDNSIVHRDEETYPTQAAQLIHATIDAYNKIKTAAFNSGVYLPPADRIK